MIRSAVKLFASVALAALLATTVRATEPATPESPAAPMTAADIAKLKAKLEEQQKQVQKLQAELEAQLKMLEQAGATSAAATPSASAPAVADAAPAADAPASLPERKPYVGQLTASAVPMVQPAPSMTPFPSSRPSPRNPRSLDPSPQAGEPPSPLQLKIGETTITPLGFMDMTAVFRTAATNNGIGTNFGGLPMNNSFPLARLTETRLNPQNSRMGARFDTNVHGAKVTGYWESDFLGSSAGNNLSVSNGAWVFRMRLYWVDVRKEKFEFLAGQSWSMITPGRNGISPVPGDLFYSQDVDVNYNVGLTWARTPQFRFVYHPSDTVAAGLSLEESDQYFGGSGGAGSPTLPSGLASTFINQLDSAANSTQTPNVIPDFIGKLAFDPKTGGLHQHVELVGLFRQFRTYNQSNNNHYNASAGGVGINTNFELVKNFHAIVNGFYSDGGGRFLFGEIPDLVIRTDGSISPIHASSGLAGFEYTNKNTLIYSYLGEYYGARNVVIDTTGKPVGYGFTGSGGTNNRSIQEITLGMTQTLWKDPKWGGLQLMLQYSWLNRYPWYVATGTPKDAHNSTVFLNLRYSLPGNPPSWK